MLICPRTRDGLFQAHTSRYLSEFEEIASLGKGSYGKVFKVRRCVDHNVLFNIVNTWHWEVLTKNNNNVLGHKQAGWSGICSEKNSHQESKKRRLYEGKVLTESLTYIYPPNLYDLEIIYLIASVFISSQVLREVKVLSSLQHPNIVGYHTAWMEHIQPAVKSQ